MTRGRFMNRPYRYWTHNFRAFSCDVAVFMGYLIMKKLPCEKAEKFMIM